MDKRLFVNLQGGRKVSGTLRGYDLFLNLVIDDAQEETTPAQRHPIGTVVCRMISKFPQVCPLISQTGHPWKQRYFDGDDGGDSITWST